MPTISEARDEIYTLLKTEWDADVISQNVPLVWADVSMDIPVSPPSAWARAQVQHFSGGQASLSGDTGAIRWRRDGIITVQIFSAYGEGLSESDNLAIIAMRAYEGKTTPSRIWFRNVRLTEVGIDGAWFQVNVTADFTYDEVK